MMEWNEGRKRELRLREFHRERRDILLRLLCHERHAHDRVRRRRQCEGRERGDHNRCGWGLCRSRLLLLELLRSRCDKRKFAFQRCRLLLSLGGARFRCHRRCSASATR